MRFLLAIMSVLCASVCHAQVNQVTEIGELYVVKKTVDPLMWDTINLRFTPAFRVLNGGLANGGNPNRAFPWTVGGGMQNVHDHGAEVAVVIPKGSYVDVTLQGTQAALIHYSRTQNGPTYRTERTTRPQARWVYPSGTRVVAFHSSAQDRFIDRIREFDGKEWHDDERHIGKVPAGFVDDNDCIKCHSHAGAQATTLPEFGSDYAYNALRGDHTVFGFSWLDEHNNIPHEYVKFVRFVDTVPVALEVPAPVQAAPVQQQWVPMQNFSSRRSFGGRACAT